MPRDIVDSTRVPSSAFLDSLMGNSAVLGGFLGSARCCLERSPAWWRRGQEQWPNINKAKDGVAKFVLMLQIILANQKKRKS